jgi:hypothetical protein
MTPTEQPVGSGSISTSSITIQDTHHSDPTNQATGVYVTVHGHFYQPPRENPYLDAIERQPSAHLSMIGMSASIGNVTVPMLSPGY